MTPPEDRDEVVVKKLTHVDALVSQSRGDNDNLS